MYRKLCLDRINTDPLSLGLQTDFAGCEKWLLSCTSARFGQVLWLRARFATESLAGEDKALDSAGCSGCPVAGILTPTQSQGDSWRVRSPLESNLSKAVEESQHWWGHGRPA